MVWDNFISQLDDQNYQTKRQSASVYFKNELEKLLKPDWQNKECKHRRTTMLMEQDHENIAAWQIDNQEKLFIERWF